MKFSRVGTVLLAIWLILKGAMPLLHLSFSGSETILAVIAIVAGILILLDK